jgi:hypothetical protein
MCHLEGRRTCLQSPCESYMKASALSVESRIHRNMVVFPAFALPTMRIRNLISRGNRGRIVSLLLGDDLDFACPILCRCEKEACERSTVTGSCSRDSKADSSQHLYCQ